jgi:hypothetical protein
MLPDKMASLLSSDQMKSIIDTDLQYRSSRRTEAHRARFVQLVRDHVVSERVYEKLLEAVKYPYNECVSVDIMRIRRGSRIYLAPEEIGMSINIMLLSDNSPVLKALNEGLSPHFRVVRRSLENEHVLCMEFRPARNQVFNPEDEDAIVLPVVCPCGCGKSH